MEIVGWSTGLIVSCLLFATTSADYLTGAHQAIRCMLSHYPPQDCGSLPEVTVPSYLLQAYNDCPTTLHESLRSAKLKDLSDGEISKLPLSLLYLIPRARLADLNGNQLGAILQKHVHETSLVQQIAASLNHTNYLLQFISKLKRDSIPQETLQILAESLDLSDFTSEFLNLPFLEQESLLAYLRPSVLLKLDYENVYKVVLLLQKTEFEKPPKKGAVRFLAEAIIKDRALLSKLSYFVMGVSPDQLLDESLDLDSSVSSFKLDLSKLQARALFKRVYHNASLSSHGHFIDCKPILFKLSPELLQQFPSGVQKYEVDNLHLTSLSLPTACQITEYVKADCLRTGRLPKKEGEEWKSQIKYLGQWVYTLPLSAFEQYKTNALSTAVLLRLKSSALSPMQAYYLTGQGQSLDVQAPNSIIGLDSFLHALPASQLTNRHVGEISSHVLEYLVSTLRADNLPRTLSLVYKIASSIGEEGTLEHLTENRDVNIILSLVSPQDLLNSAATMLNTIAENKDFYGPIVQQFPQQILAELLERSQLDSQWSWSSLLDSSHISHLLIRGLTCQHVEDMDTGLFIPIMSHYNRIRQLKADNKHRQEAFPKNLQHCSLRKLIDHLKLKMTLTQTDPDSGLISLLEPVEIESVGGYVLAGLPLSAMQVSPYLGYILAAIGKLSNAELMLAADIKQIQLIAQLVVDKEKNVETSLARNLVWFLPPNTNTSGLRLMLEAEQLDTTICLPAEARQHVAHSLLAEFGPPESWSPGVLATLQDLLIVFTDDELHNVSDTAWTEAADCFSSHYSDLVEWIQPLPFYQVCASVLGKSEENEYKTAIGRYVRYRLKAAQWQLDTVLSVTNNKVHKATSINDTFVDQEPKVTVEVFSPETKWDSTTAREISSTDENEYEYDEDDEKTGQESTSEKKTTVVKTTEESTTEKSTSEKSTSEKSTTEESTTEKSTSEKSTTEESTTEKSTSEKSTTETSTTEKSTTDRSTTEKGTTEERSTKKVTTEERTTEKRSTENITTEEAATKESLFYEQPTKQSITEENENGVSISNKSGNTVTEESKTEAIPTENIKTENRTFEKHSKYITNNKNITDSTSVKKISITNSTTQRTTTLNINSKGQENNFTPEAVLPTIAKDNHTNENSYSMESSTAFASKFSVANKIKKITSTENSTEHTRSETFIHVNTTTVTSLNLNDEVPETSDEEVMTDKNNKSMKIFKKTTPSILINKTSKSPYESQSNSSKEQENIVLPTVHSAHEQQEKGNRTIHNDDTDKTYTTPTISLMTADISSSGGIVTRPTTSQTANNKLKPTGTNTVSNFSAVIDEDFTKTPDTTEQEFSHGHEPQNESNEVLPDETSFNSPEPPTKMNTSKIGNKTSSSTNSSLHEVEDVEENEFLKPTEGLSFSTETGASINKYYVSITSTPTVTHNAAHKYTAEEKTTEYEDHEDYKDDEVKYDPDSDILHDHTERVKRMINKRSTLDTGYSTKLSCNAVKMVGSLAELALTKRDLEHMQDTDIVDCRMEFGAMELGVDLQKEIWVRIKKNKELVGVGEHLLGKLIRVAAGGDLWDVEFDITKPWSLETVQAYFKHANNNLLQRMLTKLQSRNSKFTPELLAVLGKSLCDLDTEYLEALPVVGLDLGTSCPVCLPHLAERALEQMSSVLPWTPLFTHSLQTVVAGLDLESWKKLAESSYKPLSALQPSAARCLNISHLEVLTPYQIRMIPTLTLLALSEDQLAALSPPQLEAIRNTTYMSVSEKLTPTKRIYVAGFPRGNSHHTVATLSLIMFITMIHFLRYL